MRVKIFDQGKYYLMSAKQLQPQQQLATWYRTIAGKQLLDQENYLLTKGLEGLFGYHLLTLGPLDYAEAMGASSISHQIVINDDPVEGRAIDLLGSQYELPLQSDSIDAVILPHLLEYSAEPHQILREVERVTVPNGHVIILGFNPLSCYGLCRAALGFMNRMPWKGHYYHPVRLRDWLHLLGFRITRIRYAGFVPPIPSERMLARLAFMERATSSFIAPLGSIYMIVARNEVVTPNVVKKPWKNKRPSLENGAIEPTTRIRAGLDEQ